MKRNQVFAIVIILVVLICVGVIVGVVINNNNKKNNDNNNDKQTVQDNNTPDKENVDVLDDGTKQNNSSQLLADKTFDGLNITGISLNSKNGLTTLVATVNNNTSTEKKGRPVTIVFTDKNGTEVSRMDAYVPQVLPGKTSQFTAQITDDLSNAYNFSITNK